METRLLYGLFAFILAGLLVSGCSGLTPKPDTVSQNGQGISKMASDDDYDEMITD